MFRREPSGAEIADSIIPGSKSSYYLLRIGGFLALITFSGLGGFALLDLGSDEDELRNVLQSAGPALAIGSDGVELLKVMGGASCTARESQPDLGSERWVFRVRQSESAESEACLPAPGDLVVWVEGRNISAFRPVHGDGEVVRDVAGFQRYQRRYTHGGPPGR